jgi:AcrR family transcriptional regulator
MARKPPRRTRERILETALRLFNDFGEPNVTTTTISDEMAISPGNLYYHYRNKDQIVECISEQYAAEVETLCTKLDRKSLNVEDAWLFLHLTFELFWRYRFFYRDLNDMLSRNRVLEERFQRLLERKENTARALIRGLTASGAMRISGRQAEALATHITMVATYWLSYEYVRNARHFSDPGMSSSAAARGAYHVLALASPYLDGADRALFERLAEQYLEH